MAVADLFASSVSTRLLSAAFRDQCLYRLKFCRNMLILLCVLQQDSAQNQAKLVYTGLLLVQQPTLCLSVANIREKIHSQVC